jgi:hypothetical protein
MNLMHPKCIQFQPHTQKCNPPPPLKIALSTSNFYTLLPTFAPHLLKFLSAASTFSFFKCHILNKTHIIECGPHTLPPTNVKQMSLYSWKTTWNNNDGKTPKHLKLPKHALNYQLVNFFLHWHSHHAVHKFELHWFPTKAHTYMK